MYALTHIYIHPPYARLTEYRSFSMTFGPLSRVFGHSWCLPFSYMRMYLVWAHSLHGTGRCWVCKWMIVWSYYQICSKTWLLISQNMRKMLYFVACYIDDACNMCACHSLVWQAAKKDRLQPVRNGLLPVSQKRVSKHGWELWCLWERQAWVLNSEAEIPGVTGKVCGVNVWRERWGQRCEV